MFCLLFWQDKTVSIPDGPKQWKPSEAPEFIRFVMGKFLFRLLHCIVLYYGGHDQHPPVTGGGRWGVLSLHCSLVDSLCFTSTYSLTCGLNFSPGLTLRTRNNHIFILNFVMKQLCCKMALWQSDQISPPPPPLSPKRRRVPKEMFIH